VPGARPVARAAGVLPGLGAAWPLSRPWQPPFPGRARNRTRRLPLMLSLRARRAGARCVARPTRPARARRPSS